MGALYTPYNCVACGRPKTRTEDDLCEQCREIARGESQQTMDLRTLRKAIDTYGKNAQVDMAIEEMSELTKALCKERRSAENRADHSAAISNVLEEIADVEIMLRQMIIIFDRDGEVEKEIKYKVNRLAKRLEKQKGNDK